MQKTYDAVVAGHICLDMHPIIEGGDAYQLQELFVPGGLVNLSGVSLSGGGVVSNTGFALRKLGVAVLPVTSIGDDAFGGILSSIVREHTGITIPKKAGITTSYSIILSVKDVDRIIFHDPAGNNAFDLADIDFEKIRRAKLFHFGYPPLMKKMYENGGKMLAEMFRRIYDYGVVTSIDMSLPDHASESGQVDWLDVMQKTLPYVDIFLPSAEEALYVFDREEFNRVKHDAGARDFTSALDLEKVCALGQRILDMGCAVAGVKCGEKGMYIQTASAKRLARMEQTLGTKPAEWANQALFQESYHVADFKSALAAGDTAIAGFLAAALLGKNVFDAARAACMAGALCCAAYDAVSALPDMGTLMKLIDKNPDKNRYDALETAFQFDWERKTWTR